MRIALIIGALILLTLQGCSKEPGIFEAPGETVTTLHDYGAFSQVEFYDIFDVTFTQDTINQVYITTGANMQENIRLINSEGVLEVYNDAAYRWSRAYTRPKLHIHVKDISKIVLDSPCHVRTTNVIKANQLTIWAISNLNEGIMEIDANLLVFHSSYTSTGKFELKGAADNARFKVYAAYHLDASDFSVKKALVRNASVQDLFVNVQETLETEILNSGNIYVKGQPQLTELDTSGSGSVIFK